MKSTNVRAAARSLDKNKSHSRRAIQIFPTHPLSISAAALRLQTGPTSSQEEWLQTVSQAICCGPQQQRNCWNRSTYTISLFKSSVLLLLRRVFYPGRRGKCVNSGTFSELNTSCKNLTKIDGTWNYRLDWFDFHSKSCYSTSSRRVAMRGKCAPTLCKTAKFDS